MIDDMDKLIKYINQKGCEHCPYCKYQDECHGIACYGGEPIEPPCCYQTPDHYLDFDIISQEIKDSSDEIKQTKIVVDKINTKELVVPKTNIEIIKDIVSNLQNGLSFDFNLNMPCRGGKTATMLYFDELINEEREEKDMNKVLKLYKERKLKEIDDKYDKKVEDDYNAIEVVKQYNELVMNFESKLEELFKSLENFDNGYLVTQCDSNCYKYALSEGMIKSKISDKYAEEKIADKLELDNLVGEVDAQLSLSDDLTYQLEVLNRYGIIDKKTNKMTV